jgi:hypothetical protein
MDYVAKLTSTPMFVGIMILLVNIGSRYITHEMSGSDEEYQQNIILRRLAIFAACFLGTRDLVISIILTAAFVVLAGGLLRGTSEYSKEGMANPDAKLRTESGLGNGVDAPAYEKTPPMF